MTSVALPQREPPPSYFASLRPAPRPASPPARHCVSASASTSASTSTSASPCSTSAYNSDPQLASEDDGHDSRQGDASDEPAASPQPQPQQQYSPADSWRPPSHSFSSSSDPSPRGLPSSRARPSSASSVAHPSALAAPVAHSQRFHGRHPRRGSLHRLTTLDAPDTSGRRPSQSSTGNLLHRSSTASALDCASHSQIEDPVLLSTAHPNAGASARFAVGDPESEPEWDSPSAPAASARTKRRDEDAKRKEEDKEALLFLFLLYPLRLLAIVPEVLAAHTLLRRSITLALAQQDLRRVGMRREPGPLELFMAIFWITTAGFHALSFTTLLLRRWLLYYAIFPSLIRLVLLQALCWTLVRATLWSLGPNQDLPAWIVISVTTAFSDIVTRWVTSNIADMPPRSSRSADASGHGVGLWDRRGRNWEEGYALVIKLVMGDPTHMTEGGDASEDELELEWSDSAPAPPVVVRKQQARQQQLFSALTRELFQAETELHNLQNSSAEWEADESPATQARVMHARAQAEAELSTTIAAIQAAIRQTTSPSALGGTGSGKWSYSASGVGSTSTGAPTLKKRTSGPALRRKASSSPGPSGRSSPQGTPPPGRTRRLKRRMMGRRVFHWHVALLRNGLPVAILSFATLWILLIDGM